MFRREAGMLHAGSKAVELCACEASEPSVYESVRLRRHVCAMLLRCVCRAEAPPSLAADHGQGSRRSGR